jgi:NADH-quinone oxidoreductase subunit L
MTLEQAFFAIGVCVVASPAVLLGTIGCAALIGYPLGERVLAKCTQWSVVIGLAAALAVLVLMLLTGVRQVPIELGDVVAIPQQHFHFQLKFVFDRLSVPFVILTYVLCGTVAAFTTRYLHREPGFGRFFVLYAVFFMGMVVSTLAGTIETSVHRLGICGPVVGTAGCLFPRANPAGPKRTARVGGVSAG